MVTKEVLFFVFLVFAGKGYETLNIDTDESFDSSLSAIFIANELEAGFKHLAFIC